MNLLENPLVWYIAAAVVAHVIAFLVMGRWHKP